jgi:hypothetical protein
MIWRAICRNVVWETHRLCGMLLAELVGSSSACSGTKGGQLHLTSPTNIHETDHNHSSLTPFHKLQDSVQNPHPISCASSWLRIVWQSWSDRRSVGQSVLVSGAHLESVTRFLLSHWRLRVSWYGAPSLTRARVCNLLVQLLPGLARAVTLGLKSRRIHGHILLSHLKLPQPGGPGPCIYIPQEQGAPVISPGTGFRFCRLLRLGKIWSLKGGNNTLLFLPLTVASCCVFI